jgi:hypothetical protein
MPVQLQALSTAVPPHRLPQDMVATRAQAMLGPRYPQFERMLKTFQTSGVETRYSAAPLEWFDDPHGWADRNTIYLQGAVDLFLAVARDALAQAGWRADEVDAVVSVSSTGIATPTLEALAFGARGFRPDIERVPVFGLGCAGGVSGLSIARTQAVAQPGAKVLPVVVELCTLSFRADRLQKADIIATDLCDNADTLGKQWDRPARTRELIQHNGRKSVATVLLGEPFLCRLVSLNRDSSNWGNRSPLRRNQPRMIYPERQRLDWHYHGFSILVATGAALALTLIDAGALPNGLFYDFTQRHFDQVEERRVLLVEGNVSDDLAVSSAWSPLMWELADKGAAHVIVIDLPSDVAVPLLPQTDLVVAARANPDLRLPGNSILDSQIPHRDVVAVSAIPPAQYGVHRTQLTKVNIGSESLPTLEARVAGLEFSEPFYVRFGGGVASLQRVSVADLLAGRVSGDLIAGRSVLVAARDQSALTTPSSIDWPNISLLEYHAFALETALSGRLPRPPPFILVGLLVIFVGITAVPLYVRTGPRGTLAVVLGVTIVIAITGVAAFRLLDVVLPIGELFVSQAVLSLLLWRRREVSQERTLRSRVRTLRAQLGVQKDREAVIANSAPRLADALGLQRYLVLRVNGKRLDAEFGHGPNLDEVAAQVEHTNNQLFLRAVDTRAAVQIRADEPSGLYALALHHDGTTFGLWIVEPQSDLREETLRILPLYADVLAEQLASSPEFIATPGDRNVEGDIEEASGLLVERMRTLEAALERGASELAVFDIFGAMHFASGQFLDRIASIDLNPTDDGRKFAFSSPSTVLSALTGVEECEVKRLLVESLVTGRSAIVNGGHAGKGPLRVSPASRRPGEPATLLVFQSIDVSNADDATRVRAGANEETIRLMRNDLEAMHFALAILENEEISSQQRTQTVYFLGAAVNRAGLRIETFLKEKADSAKLSPVSPDSASVLDVLADVLDQRPFAKERIDVNGPVITPAVDVPNRTLETLLGAIVDLLLSDADTVATADPAVKVRIDEDGQDLHVHLASHGAGLPEGRLQQHLESKRPAESPAMRTIVGLLNDLRKEGVHVTGTSDVGGGLSFALRMRKSESMM